VNLFIQQPINLEQVNKKREETLTHWRTYWLIYALFMQYDSLLSYVPFWSILSPLVLMASYSPIVTQTIYEGTIKTLQYKFLILDKSFNLEKHLDYMSKKYVIPCLDFMESNIAPKLPPPLNSILITVYQVLHRVVIVPSNNT